MLILNMLEEDVPQSRPKRKNVLKKKKKEGKNQKEFLNWVVASVKPPGLCRVFYQEGKGWGKNSGNL